MDTLIEVKKIKASIVLPKECVNHVEKTKFLPRI